MRDQVLSTPRLPLSPMECHASPPVSPEGAPCDCSSPSTQSVGKGMVNLKVKQCGTYTEEAIQQFIHQSMLRFMSTILLHYVNMLTISVCRCFTSLDSSPVSIWICAMGFGGGVHVCVWGGEGQGSGQKRKGVSCMSWKRQQQFYSGSFFHNLKLSPLSIHQCQSTDRINLVLPQSIGPSGKR